MKLETAREAEHRDAEEGEGIPVSEGGEDGFAPGDFLGEVEVGRKGERDGRPEENENGPAKSKFVCDDGWAIHNVRGLSRRKSSVGSSDFSRVRRRIPPKGGTTYFERVRAKPICAFVGGLKRL
jgi:hypothetical protein